MITTGRLLFIALCIILILVWLAAYNIIHTKLAVLIGFTQYFLLASYDVWRK